jgi:dihydrodipicolinate synthase/N-acetylneuraminate lyase
MMPKTLDLHGVMPAIVTVFKPDGSLDAEGTRDYLTHVLDLPGVTGILCAGYTGEGASLSLSEKRQLIEICKAVTSGRVPLIAGVDAPSTRGAIEAGIDARDAGADAIQVNSPFYGLLRRGFVANQEVTVRFFADLDREVGLPMTVFQYPSWSGLTYPPEILAVISEMDNVVGIKEAVDMDTYVADWQTLRGKVPLLADNNTYTLLSMLLLGAEGTMVGIANVGTELYIELFDLCQRGERAGAVELTNTRLLPLMNAFARDLGRTRSSFVARLKAGLVELGLIPHDGVRGPDLPASDRDRQDVHAALVSAGLVGG